MPNVSITVVKKLDASNSFPLQMGIKIGFERLDLMLQIKTSKKFEQNANKGVSLRHIQHKNDWFYEFRPMILLAFGLVGLLNGSLIGRSGWILVSQFCGAILLAAAYKIYQWRKDYRKSML